MHPIIMENDQEESQLRISALHHLQPKKTVLYPSLNSVVDYLTHKNKQSLKNRHTVSIGSDANANIRCSVIIIFAEIISKSMAQEQAGRGCSREGQKNLGSGSGCLIKHNIRFNQVNGLPETFLSHYSKEAERISKFIIENGLQIGQIFGYFRQYEDIYLPIQSSCLVHELQNFLMKKQLLARLIHFLKNKQSQYLQQQNNSSSHQSLILDIANYLAHHPKFTLLLFTAIRSVLFFQYQLYDAWDYQQQIADHTLFTAICDIFHCINMKIDQQNICCFFGKWAIWSTQIYNTKCKFQSQPQSPFHREVSQFGELMREFGLKNNQAVKRYFITEREQQILLCGNSSENDDSGKNPYNSTTNRNYQYSSFTFKPKNLESSTESMKNKNNLQPPFPKNATPLQNPPPLQPNPNHQILNKKKSYSIQLNLPKLNIKSYKKPRDQEKMISTSPPQKLKTTNTRNSFVEKLEPKNLFPISFNRNTKTKIIRKNQCQAQREQKNDYTNTELLGYLSDSVRETMQSQQSKHSKTSANTKP